jgi:hypothetical protein
MKTLLFIGCFFGGISPLYAQEIPPVVEQRLELTVEALMKNTLKANIQRNYE